MSNNETPPAGEWSELLELSAWIQRMVVRKLRPDNDADLAHARRIARLMVNPVLLTNAMN